MGVRLNIKNPETDRLARELAAATGESITTAVTIAIRERLELISGVTHPDFGRARSARRRRSGT
jgi:antitoxin VapB